MWNDLNWLGNRTKFNVEFINIENHHMRSSHSDSYSKAISQLEIDEVPKIKR